jgi:hypothetical protein
MSAMKDLGDISDEALALRRRMGFAVHVAKCGAYAADDLPWSADDFEAFAEYLDEGATKLDEIRSAIDGELENARKKPAPGGAR